MHCDEQAPNTRNWLIMPTPTLAKCMLLASKRSHMKKTAACFEKGAQWLSWIQKCILSSYRTDWEPAAASGKCMAGVPGVFWRCPAVLQGPSTHNPTWVLRTTLILKNWPIFSICMWKWGGSAPSGQARVSRPNWPQCAKSHAAWQSLSSRAEKLRIFSKIFFLIF